jgi:leucyl/phenylalanyl-tRNA--protein transferase
MTLSASVLDLAYRNGFFPMCDDQGELGWYQPDPRAILPLDGFHVSRSLRRTLRRGHFTVTRDRCFEKVMRACGDRPEGTWMNEAFIAAYGELYRTGRAHSVEVWEKEGPHKESLVGGVYGVALGAAFFAESKFHRVTDASKVALHHLVEHLRASGYRLLEVQFLTPHLERLGAIEIDGEDYEKLLADALRAQGRF